MFLNFLKNDIYSKILQKSGSLNVQFQLAGFNKYTLISYINSPHMFGLEAHLLDIMDIMQ